MSEVPNNSEYESLLADFEGAVAEIEELGDDWVEEGQKHLDNLTKPQGSLGMLEDLALSLFRMGRGKKPLMVDPAMLYTVAADHGVVAEGVSSATQEVTRQMVLNFLAGGAGINALCYSSGLDFMAVDAGVAGDDFEPHPKLVQARIAPGSANMTRGPALTGVQCLRALLLGLGLADEAAQKGYHTLAAGEMGIGNTTPSSALYAVWLGISPARAVGPGAGMPQKGLEHKAAVVARAIQANAAAVNSKNPLKILAALGGLEIAVMAGIMLGAARNRLPMLVDGFIAGAAFTAAYKLAPAVRDYCIFTHCSAETAHAEVLRRLGKKPLLDLGLRLGEGTGAALGMNILRGAAACFNNMSSFASAGVSQSK